MIVPMKHVDLLCVASEREVTLKKLRELGLMHLDLAAGESVEVTTAKGAAEEAELAVRMILKARTDKKPGTMVRSVAETLKLVNEAAQLKDAQERLEREIRLFAPYGDFDPELVKKLLAKGVDLKSVVDLPAKLPEERLSVMQAKAQSIAAELTRVTQALADTDEQTILKENPLLKDRIAFAEAKALMQEKGAVAFIAGWIPANKVANLNALAQTSGWGLLVRDPEAGETPPTLIEPPKLFRPVKALFDGLGIAPAYTEADVSVPFMCYFSLFFAMLVGDGAYGAIFLIGTLLMKKKLAKSWFTLLSVFSLATIGWGLLSNTWFGAGIPWCAEWPTVKWLGDVTYHNMMLLCFTIGVSHLMLARLWNGVCLLPDSTAISQFGWAGILLFMYFVTNAIVGIFPGIPTALYYVFGVSLVAVFGFTVKPSELKTRGAELGMLPLNVMSALGDIISYVRLFAVGLASVKVAENFNSMATGLMAGEHAHGMKALLALAMVAILVVGHGLNLAMAALSILVHAVRLNTLEFSNHKGVSWAGYAFRAFKSYK